MENSKLIFFIVAFAFAVFGLESKGEAAFLQLVDLGDTIVEDVGTGNSGSNENLGYWFGENGITNVDGSAIDPVDDQLQDELFFSSEAGQYEVEFLGIGHAGYHSPFGVFTYSGDLSGPYNPSAMSYFSPLFVQNEVAPNTSYYFNVDAGTYFGFYLDSNGTGNKLSTMIDSNSDNLDHALIFETNKGYTIALRTLLAVEIWTMKTWWLISRGRVPRQSPNLQPYFFLLPDSSGLPDIEGNLRNSLISIFIRLYNIFKHKPQSK